MADKIQRGTASNLIQDDKLKVETQLALPVKDTFTSDELGSISAGNTNRLKAKMANASVKEIANLDDVIVVATSVTTLDNSLAIVAKTGDYNNLTNKPTIPGEYTYNSTYNY